MNSSFLYHGWGLYSHECTLVGYKGSTIILNVQEKSRKIVCPRCGKAHLVKNGYRYRDFIGLPLGFKKTIIHLKIQRYKCKDCGYDQQENIPFATGSRSYTHRFAKFVVGLLHFMTIKDVSNLLKVGWDMVKDIHVNYLKRHYSSPSLKGVENIGIDEFAIKKGHVYRTIVVDLDTGRILYVGKGKGVSSLNKFWKKVKRKKVKIKYVATDLSKAFIASVLENCPDAVHVFDHFHVIKLMNEKLDDLRRSVYKDETDKNKRNVIKGIRYLLLRNGADVNDEKFKTRLDNALAMNKPLSQAYYLKEQLKEVWKQPSKAQAKKVLCEWIEQAIKTGVSQLKKMANTLKKVSKGILAWYDCRISTAKVEGINNKIKVMKRSAYGFRDDRYFTLRLFSLHDCSITQNVG